MTNFYNVINNLLKKKYFLEMLNKIFLMFFDKKPTLSEKQNLNKISENKISAEKFLRKINPNLYEESIFQADEIYKKADKICGNYKNIEFGGNYALEIHYFMTRYLNPKIILETGVAAGYSSLTFLNAIEKNRNGKLFSSDFPYFRLKNPEKYIGIVVPEKLKVNWRLEILGDKKNIETFKNEFEKIDLLFYDSDKRYHSKKVFFQKVDKLFTNDTAIIIDDLHNDSFFFEYIKIKKIKYWYILESKRNHIVGLILNKKIY